MGDIAPSGQQASEQTCWKKGRAQMEEKVFNITIDSDPRTRQGVYADRVLATTEGPLVRLDFIHGDIPVEDGVRGVLVSRIFMSVENVASLMDMLDAHLSERVRSEADDSR